jgi:hypothetical protein
MRRAMGLGDVDDSEQLHFNPYTVKLDWGKPQAAYDAKMEVKRYFFPDEGNVPAAGDRSATQKAEAAR